MAQEPVVQHAQVQQLHVQNQASKLWDENSCNMYSQQMEGKIMQIVGNNNFQSNVAQMVDNINNEASATLKSFKKPNYKYICHTLIIPSDGGYRTGQTSYWQPKTDIAITIPVNTQNLQIILTAFCIQ
eukprot:38303_1